LFTQAFWGVFLIVMGVAIVLKVLLKVEIPLVRLFIALVLIYAGIGMLLDKGWNKSQRIVAFDGREVTVTGVPESEYNILFGHGVIDLTGVSLKGRNTLIKVNTIFAGSALKLNPAIPTRVSINYAFAGVQLPGTDSSFLGKKEYHTPGFREDKPYLQINADVVFGELSIMNP
jgi:hypothetical protein